MIRRNNTLKTTKKPRCGLENLETRNLLTGDIAAGGVLGLRSDIDGDGTVGFADFLILSTTYEQESLPSINGDIDIDGDVDFHDFTALAHNFGRSTDIPTARIQVVHNSPYAAAAEVDVYLDDGLLGPLNDFSFRSATPYIDVPAGVEMKIDIAGPDSESSSPAVFSATVTLVEGETYIAVADGDPTQTEGDTAFGLFVTDKGRESAERAGNAEFLVFHGSPDAPAVDVVARGAGTLVDNLSYPTFDADYISVPPDSYTLDITPAGDNETIVASFEADLSGAADAAVLVAASGFLAPPTDADPGFGLLAVFPNGDTALLPAAAEDPGEARLQLIHNSPYSAAATVDVYVNDGLLLDDFNFRDASPYIDVPAGVELKVDITAPNAADNSSPVFNTSLTLEDGKTYVAIADGDPTVSEGATAFGVFATDIGQEAAATEGNVEFLVFHGSPDAPTVDVLARGVGVLVDDVSYPEFTDTYLSVPPAEYILDITPGGDTDTVVASFAADLAGAADAAIVVAASGFLSPAAETDPGFGLLAVFANGDTALLPTAAVESPEARLQLIHNSPYAAAASVDVYVNDGLLLDDFNFRDASPYIDVPAGVELQVDITAPNAADNSSPVFSTALTLEDGKTYVAIADGDPTVSEGATAFGVFATDIGQEAAAVAGNVEFLVFHGSPDAPTVDVLARGVRVLVDDLSYPEFTDGYLSVPPAAYTLDITPGGDNDTVVAAFAADLAGAADAAIVVAASGFLAPAGDDPAFGLLAVFGNGDTALLPAAVDVAMAG